MFLFFVFCGSFACPDHNAYQPQPQSLSLSPLFSPTSRPPARRLSTTATTTTTLALNIQTMPIQSPGTTASSSTGFSHKFRGFTHLSKNKTKTTGTEQPEEEIGGKEFEIVNTPDRPTRVISTAEVPTEEECGELILRWHLAAKRREVCLPPLTWSGGGGDRRVQMVGTGHVRGR
ncbi:hypothetical protein B0J18DRAFT_153924 [Chaetomium sp. MPI-SDFR-AT-0129]|nr:hypothetical protein B0J18DRAFT_153924 [Chaetomium sp. MPI-SDFR-AT-0129]